MTTSFATRRTALTPAEPPPGTSTKDSTVTPIWEASSSTSGPPTTTEVLHRQRSSDLTLEADLEAGLVAALTSPLPADMSHRDGGALREQLVADHLMELDARAAFVVLRRLQRNAADDPLAIAFQRLLSERRARLMRILERRRTMLATKG